MLLDWANEIFKTEKEKVWSKNPPPARWIVNFDYDWMDGLVLATIIAKFCPWVIEKLNEMHLNPFMPELCLHNALILTDVLKELQENAQTFSFFIIWDFKITFENLIFFSKNIFRVDF